MFKKYFLIALIIASINAALLLAFFVPRFDHTDSPEYISTIEYIAGDQNADFIVYRFLKPLPILIGSLSRPFIEAGSALILQNLIFYYLSVCLVFLLVFRLYNNEKQALYGTVLYMGAYPMLAYGLASLTDLSGWFFYLLSVLISLRFLDNPGFKTAFWAGLLAGFGMLFKESTAAAPIFFASLLFIASPVSFKDKMKYIVIYGSAFLIFPVINSIIFYNLYSYTYYDWFRLGGAHPENSDTFYVVSPLRVLIETIRVFSIGWFFILAGAFKEWASKNNGRIKVFLAFLLPSLSVFVFWSYPHNRMLYIAFPLLVLLGSLGILRERGNQKTSNILEAILLVCYLLVNYASLEFFLRYGPSLQNSF